MLSGTETCFVRPNRSRRIFVDVVGTQLLISKSPSVMNMISALPLSCISSACGHRILIFNRTLMSKAICVIPKMPLVTLYKILLFTSSLHHTPCITQNTGYIIFFYIYILYNRLSMFVYFSYGYRVLLSNSKAMCVFSTRRCAYSPQGDVRILQDANVNVEHYICYQ